MKSRATNLLVTVAFVFVFWLIWSRLRIIVFIPMPWYVAVGIAVGMSLAVFLVLDHLLNRSR